MGQPEDLTKPPLTEADVRRIVQQELGVYRSREMLLVRAATLKSLRLFVAGTAITTPGREEARATLLVELDRLLA